MEASEKPQLPLDIPDQGNVRAIGDRIVVERLELTDERAARVIRERAEAGQPAGETVTKAIEIGARVLDTEETAVNVDYVRRELEAGLGQLDERLGGTLAESAETIAEQLAEAFGGDDSVQTQIREIVTANTRDQMEAIVRTLTAEDNTNPLVNVQKQLGKAMLESEERHRAEVETLREGHNKAALTTQKQMGELRETIARLLERDDADQRVAAEAERGTGKGRTFEQLAHAVLEEIAAEHDDAAIHTGDKTTESGAKKGDTVIEVGGAVGASQATIVFESKNKKLSKNDAWAELSACMRERDAGYAVLLVAGDDKVPSGLDELTEYQGNKMIAVLDRDDPDPLALRLVYRYARARVLAVSHGGLEVDAAGVRDAAEEAAAQLKRVNRIRKSLTGVTNSADTAREELDSMVADVESCIDRIESLVAAATDE